MDDVAKTVGGVLVVQPALEPWPSVVRRIGPLAGFLYVRVSSFAIGLDVLSAGFAVHLGPLMFGVCHLDRQLAAFDRAHLIGARHDR